VYYCSNQIRDRTKIRGSFVKTKRSKSNPSTVRPPAPKYQPNAREQIALRKHIARRNADTAPRLKVLDDEIRVDHPDRAVGNSLLMEALGTGDFTFYAGLLLQLANAGATGYQIQEQDLNFMLSVVKGAKPRDQFETMLAAQMAAIHIATMTFARRLRHVENIPQQDSAERALNKLARTYAAQLEALKRYRTGGEQKVTVQHVSVSDGGQAIVGNVTRAPAETAPEKTAEARPAIIESQQQTPITMTSEPAREPAPIQRGRKGDGRSSA